MSVVFCRELCIWDSQQLNHVFYIVTLMGMVDYSEMPCVSCQRHSAKNKEVRCIPGKCRKLNEWLMDRETPKTEKLKAPINQEIPYIV